MIYLLSSWLEHLKTEFEKDYMKNIESFLESEIKAGKIIYPESGNIFNSLNSTDFEDVKVVILGQDPYHGPNQAHGLSFSVLDGIKFPPSLRNIFKEIQTETGKTPPISGNLTKWAKSGVLLLNSILTVEAGLPASHSKIGWEVFTDEIIKIISDKKESIIFILWGAFAQSKEELIDSKKHYILKSAHPSPLSAYRGFFGNNHFIKINEILRNLGKDEIDW